MPSYSKAASKMAGTFASAISRGADNGLSVLPGLFGDRHAAREQQMRLAADFLTDIERRPRRRRLVGHRVMDEQPQAAQALQAGHAA